jgi:hypothetical protein
MATTSNRRVVQIEPTRGDGDNVFPRILDYLDRKQIILLGDPGAGKSHCFRTMAAAEHAPIYSVQQFVARNGDDMATTIYLDGLDEYRPRSISRDSNPAITLLQLLRKTGSPRLRLSCRFADWLGTTDLKLFKDYCGGEDYAVLALEPLDYHEALEILANNGVLEPSTFLEEAAARQMEWTVSNPQNLLMLAGVVAHSGWPATKLELYEQSSLRYLAERNEDLQNSPLGSYSAEDLIDPAGAGCAALLISDVIGIGLGPASVADIPSYRSVPYPDHVAVLAALSRTAFRSTKGNVTTCVHRTIAEYLGARWLGKRINAGLPLSRIQALVGVDSHPVPSLRGLHAWLPLFVPLQANALISIDAMGVLTYGDTASLPAPQKTTLIKCLGKNAAENAWFWNESLSDYGLAGLSCSATAEQLVAILRSDSDPAALKTLVLHAIAVGEPLTSYRPQLERILADPTGSPGHRQLAFRSLRKYGPDGVAVVVGIYRAVISGESGSIGLKSTIVGSFYGSPFGPTDVLAILNDAAPESHSQVMGELFPLDRGIPFHNLLEVLEEYERQSPGQPNFEVSASIERMIARLCEAIPEDDLVQIDRLLRVMRGLYEASPAHFRGSTHLNKILYDRERLSQILVDSAVRHLDEFKFRAGVAFTLGHLTQGAISTKMVAERLLAEFDSQVGGRPFSPDLLVKYEAIGRSLYSSGLETASSFERFIEIGRAHPECKTLLETYTSCEIEQWRLRQNQAGANAAESRVRLRKKIQREIEALQRGESPDLQGHLGMLYVGWDNSGQKHIRRKQLIFAVGEPLTEAIERGFVALVQAQMPPTLADIANISAADEHYYYWYAFLAGMDLLWESRNDLEGLSTGSLTAAFGFSLLLDTFDAEGNHFPGNVREWSRRILRDRPEIAEAVCTALLTERLRLKRNINNLLHRIPDAESASWRSQLGLRLLLDFELENITDLQRLCLMAAETDEGRTRLADIAQARIFVPSTNRPSEDLLWIVVGFLLTGEKFETKLAAIAPTHPTTLWIIRSLARPIPETDGENARLDLTLHQMEFIVRAFGTLFPSTAHPTSSWGDESDYDAATYLRGLVTAISNRSESAASESLGRLLACEDLTSYHSWISSRLTEQREVNRRSRYETPTWQAVCAVLKGGPPVNIEDLRALLLADLVDAAKDIRHSNLDKYRVYWGGGRNVLGMPRDEDFCRDRLAEYLRERLSPMGLRIEPEGHMAADKRADMVVFGSNDLKLPVEVKRDTHPDLWAAAKNQLERLYARDPDARGYGVYLVFYYGAGRGCSITPHPEGGLSGDTPEELLKALNASVPTEHRDRIACVVIDVSPPALPRSKSQKPN